MRASEVLRRLGEGRPLVHHLTNYVTVNLVANATLATGALPVMANAVEEVRQAAALVTRRGGGEGAVREAIEHLLREGGQWDRVMQRYLGVDE